MIGSFPLIVAVNPRLPVRGIRELIDYAKANPGNANYASSAGIFQIATELFKQKTGTRFEMIPYKGSGESVQAGAAGQGTKTLRGPPPPPRARKKGAGPGPARDAAT